MFKITIFTKEELVNDYLDHKSFFHDVMLNLGLQIGFILGNRIYSRLPTSLPLPSVVSVGTYVQYVALPCLSLFPLQLNSTKLSLAQLIFLTNPKSKSKVQVQVQTDEWVFIKIRFSNHPASHPPTRESFKEAR